MTPHPRIRPILRLDAAVGLVAGLAMAGGAGLLAGPLGLPQPLLLWAGLALFPCATLMLLAAARRSAALAWVVVIGNWVWAAASLGVVALASPTPLGAAFILIQAAVVAGFAWAEGRALRPAPLPA